MAELPPRVRKVRGSFRGPVYHLRRDPLRWIPAWFAEHGDLFMIRGALGRVVMAGSPDLARQVLVDRYARYQAKSRAYAVLRILMGNGLVTSAGEFWRGQRKLVQPAFHRRRLDALMAMMTGRVADGVERLAPAAGTGRAVDLAPLLSQLTLDIISRAMFSSDVQGAASEVSRHIGLLNEYALRMLRNPWLFLLPRRFPTPFNRARHRSLEALNGIVSGILQSRRHRPGEQDDLLGMLLSACDEGTGRGMSEGQLRDEVMTLFVAGHETTANAMAWLLHLVSRHPAVEEALLAEIDRFWTGAPLAPADLERFAFTRQVIEESLRVYPSIWSIGRCCTEEDELGGCRIPAGTNLVVPIFHFHWSERYWEEPRNFDPGRFSPARRPPPERLIYFPFGAGPRSCIGSAFALQELMILTILFHRHYRFRTEPGFKVEADPLITLRPKHGMRMVLERRRARDVGEGQPERPELSRAS